MKEKKLKIHPLQNGSILEPLLLFFKCKVIRLKISNIYIKIPVHNTRILGMVLYSQTRYQLPVKKQLNLKDFEQNKLDSKHHFQVFLQVYF